MSGMRIVHVLAKEAPGDLSGVDMHVLELAVAQAQSGHRPLVVEWGRAHFASRAQRHGLRVMSVASPATAVGQLARLTAVHDADVLHAHGPTADVWTAAARLAYPSVLGARTIVFTQHGVVDGHVRGRVRTALDALSARVAHGIIACAEELVPRMARWNPRALVDYIPNGVLVRPRWDRDAARRDLSRRYGVPYQAPLVCYVGRLSPEKAPERVLRAVAGLRARGIRAHLLMVGSGPLEASLRAEARRLGIDGATSFAGLVTDTAPVYSGADVVALLSRTEATPRVVVEAMTAGVPVVASAVGGIPQLLGYGRYGWVVPEGDREAAVAAVAASLTTGREVARRAQLHARAHFSVESMSVRIARFYRAAAVHGARVPHHS